MNSTSRSKTEILKGSVSSDYDTMDYRSPEMYNPSIPDATKVIIEWFEAYSRRNVERMRDLTHFPFVHVEENARTRIESPDDLLRQPPRFMDVRSIALKDYDTLEGLTIPLFRPAQVGFFLTFGRYHANGERFLQGEAFFSVQKNAEAKWELRQSSTILKPADQQDVFPHETIESARRLLHLYNYSYGVKNQALLDELGWPYEKVDFERFARMAGSRLGSYDHTIAAKIDIPQCSTNKAHCLVTFIRRQCDGSPISVGRGLYVVGKQDWRWRMLLVACDATEHDFSNDSRASSETATR